MSGISSSYYSNLGFSVAFSTARTTLYSTSSLIITFSQPILTAYSTCSLSPSSNIFSTFSIDATKTVYTLIPHSNIAGFTYSTYIVNCTHIVTNGNHVNVSMVWKDSTYTLQYSNNLTILHSLNSLVSTATATLANKNYNSPAYSAEYTLTISLPASANSTHKLQIYIDFYPLQIFTPMLECEYYNSNSLSYLQILCMNTRKDTESEVYIEYVPYISTASLQLRIYGIMTAKLATMPTFKLLIKKTNLLSNQVNYYTAALTDTPATPVSNNPIILYNQIV